MIHNLFTCPACLGPLASNASTRALRCEQCEISYPLLGTIPLLLAEPDQVMQKWREELTAFSEETEQTIKQLLMQLVQEELPARARARLTSVIDSLPIHLDRILQLFASVGIFPSHSPSEPKYNSHRILSYESLIHRDYSWPPEADEVTPALNSLLAVLPKGHHWGKTLILGAGTGRLGWDLALRASASGQDALFVAVDINPLPFLITQSLLQQEPTRFFELPGHPKRSSAAALDQLLCPPGASPESLHLVFADAMNPPFKKEVFDHVITPWFVDQVPKNLVSVPPMIRHLLRPGGSWVNTGPFVYDPKHTHAAHRYCADEFLAIVGNGGFQVTRASYDSTAYLASPLSTQGRTEFVLNMHARKLKNEPTLSVDTPNNEPVWLHASTGVGESIPKIQGLDTYSAPHPTITLVLQLIDGKRTVRQIAEQLVEQGILANDGSAETAVRGCLRVVELALHRST